MRPTLILRREIAIPFSSARNIKQNCRKVVCIGRNYAEHAAELSNAAPVSPFFFLKPPSSILCPGEGPIVRPRGVELHHEVELGLVMGRRVRDLDEGDVEGAMGSVACYLIAIDLTARNLQSQLKAQRYPWTTAKGFDTFCPISEPVAPSVFPQTLSKSASAPQPSALAAENPSRTEMLHNPYTAHLKLSVTQPSMVDRSKTESILRQSDSASLMLFRIPRLLSEISRVMSLEEGDLVLTGTPKGVGPLVGGSRVEVTLDVDSGDRGANGVVDQVASAGWNVEDAREGEPGGMYEYKK